MGGAISLAVVAQANPPAQNTVDLIGLLRADVSPEAQAIPNWTSNAMTNPGMRARLGSPIAMQVLYPAQAASRFRNTNPDLPANRLSRFVRLSFPSLASAQAMRRILLGNGLFEHVEIADALKFSFTAITVPDPYYGTIQTGNALYSYSGVTMLKNPYGVTPRPSYLPLERSSWAAEQTQWYMEQMKFKEAWELLGDDDFDSNPANGFYGTTNIAVLDSGIDPQCDPYFENPVPSNCFDTSYNIQPPPTLSNFYRGAVRPPHQQLAKNLRRLQSYAAKSDTLSSFAFVSADIISEPGIDLAGTTVFSYASVSPLGVEGNPVRRGFFSPATPTEKVAATGHGTHTAGLIGASMDGIGTVGTCPTCSLNYFQISVGDNASSNNAANQMIQLANRNGVQVMNMSFTARIEVDPGAETGAESSESVINTVLSAAADDDVFLVASAGNNFNPFQTSSSPSTSANLPASHPKVIAAGGTMASYVSNQLQASPLSWSERASGSRCGTTGTDGCGTAYTNDTSKKMLYAPAGRILPTMHGSWNNVRAVIDGPGLGLAGCTNELYPADASRGPGTSPTYPTFNSRYGMCTGTSMSAPILSGLAGLVRSANPLLSIDATYAAMQNGAVPVLSNPAGAVNTVQPLADKTVERVLGQFQGSLAANRVIPLFAARSTLREGTAHIDWLYSSKPQVMRAAMLGNLYWTDPDNRLAGTRKRVNYDSTTTLPPVVGYTFNGAVNQSRGRASFYVFATQRRPFANSQSLVPLYRLATDSPLVAGSCDGRKHAYATPGSFVAGVDSQTYFTASSRPRCQYILGSNSAPPPAANAARYALVATEGFIFSPSLARPNGTVALYLRYSSSADSYALVTENDVDRPEYAGYTALGSSDTLLGYVYENDAQDVAGNPQTSDGDDWPAHWELAAGLNADRADSDCDGVSDSAEYPVAALPVSDPLVNNCSGGNIDSYAVGAAPARGLASARSTEFRLRNYSAVTQNFKFDVEYNPLNTMPVTPNFGAATCNVISTNPMRWRCDVMVAPGVAGNVPFTMSTDCTLGMREPVIQVSLVLPDGYLVNNYASRALCQ